jgi:hypothetical protein
VPLNLPPPQDFVTPSDIWFIRHHHPVPIIEEESWRLGIGGAATRAISLSMVDLKTRFPKVRCERVRAPSEYSKPAPPRYDTNPAVQCRYCGYYVQVL